MGALSRAARVSACFLLVGVLTPPVLLVMVLLLPWRRARIDLGIGYGHVLGSWTARLLGFRFDVEGRERLQALMPAIYVLNHSSMLDLLLGLAIVPFGACSVAKKEIARVPLFGQAYWLSGHLLLDRRSREKAHAAMDAATETMKRLGLGAWIWPEGTRSPDGELQPFKKGFVHFALATGLPVVPIVIHDAPARWPARTFDFRPGVLRVEVLEVIPTDDWALETVAEHAESVHAVFAERLTPPP
jgi:1-acyl-sn-glycerol-3-phosphate acyltransferase